MKKSNDKYEEWFHQIHEEILDLNTNYTIWENMINIENNSSHFRKTGRLFQIWQNNNFVFKIVIQLCRLTENGNRTDDRSLYNFLIAIRDNNILSYKNYRNLYGTLAPLILTEEGIIEQFENLTKQKYTDSCFCETINNDINKLTNINNSIKKFRNKHIAHLTSYSGEIKKITFKGLKKNIEELAEIVNKYSNLLYANTNFHELADIKIENLLKDLFKKAWIN